MEPFRYHIFLCTQEKPEGVPCCPASGAWGILGALDRELRSQGLDDDVQVSTCGCLGLCDDGPIMIVYPEGVWYRKVKADDVHEIVTSHLRAGKVVSRLEWNDAPAMKAASSEHRDRYRAMVRAKDEAGTLPDNLNEMVRAYMPSRALLTALELDIFSATTDGASAAAVAKRIHAEPRATELLLNALVSLKLLEKKNDLFFDTSASARFFASGSRDNARGGLMHTAHLWDRWSKLTESVRSGKPAETRADQNGWVKDFIAAMDRNAKERSGAVVKAVGAGSISRMLDLGGGSGAYSIAFANAVPGMKSEIVDLPDVVPLAQEYIRKADLAERISVRAGDMLRDTLGENYDLILVSAICHMFSPEENLELLRRAHAALTHGGQVVVQDFILEPNKTAPTFAALFSLNMLVGTQAGRSYSEPEYTAWMRDAGFAEVRRVRMPGPAGLMIARK